MKTSTSKLKQSKSPYNAGQRVTEKFISSKIRTKASTNSIPPYRFSKNQRKKRIPSGLSWKKFQYHPVFRLWDIAKTTNLCLQTKLQI